MKINDKRLWFSVSPESAPIYFTKIMDPAAWPGKMSDIFMGPGLFRYLAQKRRIKVWQVQHLKKSHAGRDNWIELKEPGHYYLTMDNETEVMTIHKLISKRQIEEYEKRMLTNPN
jgi:hypothetical protein